MNTNFKFIHCADLHLDAPFNGINISNQKFLQILRKSTFLAFDKIIKTAISQKVDFMLISGDIFNSSEKSLYAQLSFLKQMVVLKKNNIPCFLIHGNHDPLNGWEIETNFPQNVHRFSSNVSCETIIKNGEALVNIIGYSYPKREVTKNISLDISKIARMQNNEAFTIGLLHCNVGKNTTTENYAPCSLADLNDSTVDYWALGHVHTMNILQHETPAIVYPGNPQGLHINDNTKKGFYIVNVHNNKPEFDFIKTAQFRWFNVTMIIDDSSIQDLIETLKLKMYSESFDIPGIFRFHIEGQTNLHNELRKNVKEIEKILREETDEEQCFLESILINTKPLISMEELSDRHDFIGIFLKKMNELSYEKESVTFVSDLLSDFSAINLLNILPKRGEKLNWESVIEEAKMFGLDYLMENEHET
ncbi:MAG: DNA repair exonuclease [Caldisericia bacterium]|nr:DNA repair exonuclease [Caldisericia bacterium]